MSLNSSSYFNSCIFINSRSLVSWFHRQDIIFQFKDTLMSLDSLTLKSVFFILIQQSESLFINNTCFFYPNLSTLNININRIIYIVSTLIVEFTKIISIISIPSFSNNLRIIVTCYGSGSECVLDIISSNICSSYCKVIRSRSVLTIHSYI